MMHEARDATTVLGVSASQAQHTA
eukprot:SAG31_NODE_819_length_11811_cov_3.315488_1_plen_23_part_10